MAPDAALLRRAALHLRRADPVLASIIARVGTCRFQVDARGGPFAALVEAIVYQQLHGKAAATIHGRLLGLMSGRHPRPEHFEALRDAELRGVGLSRQKIGY